MSDPIPTTDDTSARSDGSNDYETQSSRLNRRTLLKVAGAGIGAGALGIGGPAAMGNPLIGVSAAQEEPGVDPQTISVKLAPGESTTVDKTVTTTAIPPKIDVFLLEDETGSFGDDIDNLQNVAPDIWDAISAANDPSPDFTMGVAGFRDFAQDFYGTSGDWVYDRYQDLTATRANFVTGVNSLSAAGGGDTSEGYLEALHYIAVNSALLNRGTAAG